jgi:HEAT repeat protein
VLTDIADRYERLGDHEARNALSRITRSRHSERNMASIAEVLAGGSETEHEHCRSYLRQVCPQAIPNLIRLLSHCTRPSARASLAASIAEVGKSCPLDIVRAIDVAVGEEVGLALDVMESIGTEEALASTLQFSKHSSAKVRAKVAQLTAKLGNRKALETARRLILDEDHGVRRRALSSLVEISGDGSAETLISLFTSNDFHNLSHDSKLSMLLVIRSLSLRGQQKVIRSILKVRRFFKRKPLEDTKAALAEILHLMNREIALVELRNLCEKSSGKIRKAAGSALEKMRDEDTVN